MHRLRRQRAGRRRGTPVSADAGFLSGYAPDLNRDERVWRYAKRSGVAPSPLRKGEKPADRVYAQLVDTAARPDLVRSFFKHPSDAYISDL